MSTVDHHFFELTIDCKLEGSRVDRATSLVDKIATDFTIAIHVATIELTNQTNIRIQHDDLHPIGEAGPDVSVGKTGGLLTLTGTIFLDTSLPAWCTVHKSAHAILGGLATNQFFEISCNATKWL